MSVRLLLPKHILQQIARNIHNGATMSSQLRLFDLQMSLPALTKLVRLYDEGFEGTLFPDWVGNHSRVYKQPKGVKFVGTFPYGHWEHTE